MQNPYLPYPVRIDEISVEAEDKSLKTFKFVFLNEGDEEKFAYSAGQFAELSIPGKGEIPIGIASSPVEKGFVKFTVNRAGVVTTHLHNMREGDIMGIRGPLGNSYPWELLEGKNVLIVGGAIHHLAEHFGRKFLAFQGVENDFCFRAANVVHDQGNIRRMHFLDHFGQRRPGIPSDQPQDCIDQYLIFPRELHGRFL